MTVAEQFIAALPAGEWAGVRVLNGSELAGLMAKRNWAILAEATALRHGGRRAFLKCIVAAPQGAGRQTKEFTGRQRLERIRVRLADLNARSLGIPLVQILECRFLTGFDGLLVAMDRVATLDRVIDSGDAGVPVALQVLRELRAPHEQWHHFDVCPKNVARTDSGTLVYIDVESLYLADATAFDVSAPIGKMFRWPAVMRAAIVADMVQNKNRIGVRLGAAKQAFDLALLAAECCLGTFDFTDDGITQEWLDQLVADARAEQKELAVFWAKELRPAVVDDNPLDVAAIAARLEAFMKGKQLPPPAKAEPAPVALPPPTPDVVSDFDRAWQALQPIARALRRDSLGRAAIEQYRQQLEALSRRYPERSVVWNELLLVLISYERDPGMALQVANEATRNLPTNGDLQRMEQIVTMWAAG